MAPFHQVALEGMPIEPGTSSSGWKTWLKWWILPVLLLLWKAKVSGWGLINLQLDRRRRAALVWNSGRLVLTIRLCCIMLWRSVFHHTFVFSVHSAHALQLLDARRTKVCPYVCTTFRVHNIESPSVCRVFFRHLAIPLHHTTSFPMNPVTSQRKGDICSSSVCLLVPWLLLCFPINSIEGG